MSTTKTHIQDQFNRTAANYRTSAIHAMGDDLAWLIAAQELTGQEQVLDVGTGTGNTAFAFAPYARQVIGIDLTAGMLAQARLTQAQKGLTNVEFRQADVESLPFPDASFDIVVSRYCAHHYERIQTAVAEIRRVLKPNGVFLLVDSYSPEDTRHATFENTLEMLRDTSHVRNYQVSEWQAYLAAVGFESEVLKIWGLRLDGDNWVERMKTPAPLVAALKEVLATADSDLQAAFNITPEPDWGFDLPVLLLKAF